MTLWIDPDLLADVLRVELVNVYPESEPWPLTNPARFSLAVATAYNKRIKPSECCGATDPDHHRNGCPVLPWDTTPAAPQPEPLCLCGKTRPEHYTGPQRDRHDHPFEPAAPQPDAGSLREDCGATRPNGHARCLQPKGHAGDHATARRDVTWPQALTQPQPDTGSRTECSLVGVHAHSFRGPHVFHEWEPGTQPDARPTGDTTRGHSDERHPACCFETRSTACDAEDHRWCYGCTCDCHRIASPAPTAAPGLRVDDVRTLLSAVRSHPERRCQYATAFRRPCDEVEPSNDRDWCRVCKALPRVAAALAPSTPNPTTEDAP